MALLPPTQCTDDVEAEAEVDGEEEGEEDGEGVPDLGLDESVPEAVPLPEADAGALAAAASVPDEDAARGEGEAAVGAARPPEAPAEGRSVAEAAGGEAGGLAAAAVPVPSFWEYRDWEASGAAELMEFFFGGEGGEAFAGGEAAAGRLRARGPAGEAEEGWAELLESADPNLRRDAAAAVLHSCLRPAGGEAAWLPAARAAARRAVRAGAVPPLARCTAGALEAAMLRGGPAPSGGCEAAFGAACAFANALYALLALAPGPPPAPPPPSGPAASPPGPPAPPPDPAEEDEPVCALLAAQLRERLWPGEGAPVLATVLMSALERLDRPTPPPIPARKILLLLWRTVLLSLGGTAELRHAKLAARAALPPSPEAAPVGLKSRAGDAERLEAGARWQCSAPPLACPPLAVAEGAALLRRCEHAAFAALRRRLADDDADPDAPRRAAAEVLYAGAMGGGGRHVLLLLKLLLAASSAVRNYSGSIDLHAELALARRLAPSVQAPGPSADEPVDGPASSSAPPPARGHPRGDEAPAEELAAHKELVVKSVAALLLLYLKHFRANDEALGERMRELLLHANAVLLLLKVAHLDVLQRTKRPPPPPALDCLLLDSVGRASPAEYAAFAAAQGGSWRAHFTTANVLRVLQRVTKRSEAGTRALTQYKAAGILKRAAEWGEGDVQLYALKLLKGQVREQGRKWRLANMHLITAIYGRVRLDLADPWLSYPSTSQPGQNGPSGPASTPPTHPLPDSKSPAPAPTASGTAGAGAGAASPPAMPPIDLRPAAVPAEPPPVQAQQRVWCTECAVEIHPALLNATGPGGGRGQTCLRCMARLLQCSPLECSSFNY